MQTNTAGMALRQKLLITRIMSVALAGGLVLFLIVTMLMRSGGETGGGRTALVLTGMVALLWLAGALAGPPLYRQQLSPERLGPRVAGLDEEAAANAILPLVQVACLLRWSLLEGPGLFAIMVLFISHGSLREQPLLAINLALALTSAAGILLTAPSEPAVRELVRRTLQTRPARR